MSFDFRFHGIDSVSDVTALIDFMATQALGYPGYDAWLQRIEPELHMAYKQAVLAFSDHTLVGDVVYQPHKNLPRTLEIKNMRVHPGMRRRDFGHFLLKQVEAEATQTRRFDRIMIDARASQRDVLKLLEFTGYKEIARVALYDSNEEDVILVKPITQLEAA